MNKYSKSATGKDAARIGTECHFWSRAAKVLLKILGILGNWRESLAYSTGLAKHSDHRSPRDFLNLNDS